MENVVSHAKPQVWVRSFGTDTNDFLRKSRDCDRQQTGVRLDGVRATLKVDEIVGITYGTTKIHFRVIWVGTWNSKGGSRRSGKSHS